MNELIPFIKARKGLIMFMDLVALEQRGTYLYVIVGIKERSLNDALKPSWKFRDILVNSEFTSQDFIDLCKVNKIKCSVFAGDSTERYII